MDSMDFETQTLILLSFSLFFVFIACILCKVMQRGWELDEWAENMKHERRKGENRK